MLNPFAILGLGGVTAIDTSVAGDGTFDLFVATLQTKDTVTVGEDVVT